MSETTFLALMTIIVVSVCIASVKGCAIVNDPAAVKANTEAQILLHQEYKK